MIHYDCVYSIIIITCSLTRHYNVVDQYSVSIVSKIMTCRMWYNVKLAVA